MGGSKTKKKACNKASSTCTSNRLQQAWADAVSSIGFVARAGHKPTYSSMSLSYNPALTAAPHALETPDSQKKANRGSLVPLPGLVCIILFTFGVQVDSALRLRH